MGKENSLICRRPTVLHNGRIFLFASCAFAQRSRNVTNENLCKAQSIFICAHRTPGHVRWDGAAHVNEMRWCACVHLPPNGINRYNRMNFFVPPSISHDFHRCQLQFSGVCVRHSIRRTFSFLIIGAARIRFFANFLRLNNKTDTHTHTHTQLRAL